jgi:anti-sigma factor RsiW
MHRRCSRASGLVSLVGLTERSGSARADRHVSTCLRCQRDRARWRRVAHLLGELRLDAPEIPSGLLGDVLAAVTSETSVPEPPADTSGMRGRLPVVIAAVGLGLAAGVLAMRGAVALPGT